MGIRDVINTNLVQLNMNASNKYEAIEELAKLLDEEGVLTSKQGFLDSVIHRESIASTYCGFELALPHGVSDTVKKPTICFGRTKSIIWDEDEEDEVKFIFLIAIPEVEEGEDSSHINILSSIATLCLEDSVRYTLFNANTPEELLAPFINLLV